MGSLSSAVRVGLAALAAALVGGVVAGGAAASQGVAIDVGAISIDQTLRAGETYRLPVLGVRNPGDEPARYRMSVGGIADDSMLDPPQDWLEFAPVEFELAPGGQQVVEASLHVPPDALDGTYEGLLRAELSQPAFGTAVGAAAAARISFEVGVSDGLSSWVRGFGSIISGLSPWVYLVPIVLAFVLAIHRLARRYQLRLERRRD